ncbi:PilZ domain-containing protein [Actinoplanes sp. NPDC026670]|uniref:PilZ domain-containing protein n=1 Tax=Actinoplanes sp. NPDC026670 TaxID=3154700 RepID=UPI0033D1B08E
MGSTTENPQPWAVPSVTVSIGGGEARTCRATREVDGTLRLGLSVFAMVGVDATVLWTQNGRGFSITGTVVAAPPNSMPGIYLRVDETTSGIERRRNERLPVEVPVVVVLPSGHLFPGRTMNLSAGGAHVIVDLDDVGDDAIIRLSEDLTRGAQVHLEVLLPDGPLDVTCQVGGGGDDLGDVRLLFVDVKPQMRAQINRFIEER